MDSLFLRLDQPDYPDSRRYDNQVDELVAQIVRAVGADMKGQPASMVYELINTHLERRLPGVPVDREPLRQAAARIAVGLPMP